MTRRVFGLLSFYLLIRPVCASSKINSWDIIKVTLEHLFPKYKQFEGAKSLNFLQFLKINSKSKYFDKYYLDLLLRGAKYINKTYPNFMTLSKEEKENILREFENTSLGYEWLSMMMYYGFEAMLSDPIYGGNINGNGWKALNHHAGIPQPKVKYARL